MIVACSLHKVALQPHICYWTALLVKLESGGVKGEAQGNSALFLLGVGGAKAELWDTEGMRVGDSSITAG